MRRSALHRSPRLPWGPGAHVGGSVVIVIGTFLPWLYSGERGLSIYELHDVARRLELVDDPWILAPIALIPLGLACAVALRWTGRHGAALAVAGVAAAYTAFAALLLRSTELPRGVGIDVALAGAAMLVLGSVLEVGWSRRVGKPIVAVTDSEGRIRPTRPPHDTANDGATPP